ncbi:MAG: hypothetical protein J5483_00730 [Lachnospiraceae bacterium]|nr:hypothetical protein [Lachnospiraceae bacterium]
MEESKKFERGETLFVNFRDFLIKGYRESDFKGKSRVHTYISMPSTSAYKGYQLDFTGPVWDQQIEEDGDRRIAEGWKTLRIYENAEYTLRNTPRKEDGSFDYENQTTVKITGSDLKRELDSWRTEKTKSPETQANCPQSGEPDDELEEVPEL